MPAGHGHVTLTFNVSSYGANNWTPTTSISDLLCCRDEEINSRHQYQLNFKTPNSGTRNGAFFICGVNMAVQISGVLKDGAGKPIQNCTIQLEKQNVTAPQLW